MKKFYKVLTFLLVAIMGIGLGLALSPSQPSIENEVECDYGKNYLEYNCQEVLEQPSYVVNAKEKLDTNKYPSYMIDAEGYYLQFDELGRLFKEKYFGVIEEHQYDNYVFLDLSNPNITKFKFVLEGNYNADDIYAKAVLLLNEFRNYEFYYVSNGVIIIEVYWIENGLTKEVRLGVSTATLLNQDFTLGVATFFDNEFGSIVEVENCQVNQELAQNKYDQYVTEQTYIGYVLDYK